MTIRREVIPLWRLGQLPESWRAGPPPEQMSGSRGCRCGRLLAPIAGRAKRPPGSKAVVRTAPGAGPVFPNERTLMALIGSSEICQ
jgi:hypothetical protein